MCVCSFLTISTVLDYFYSLGPTAPRTEFSSAGVYPDDATSGGADPDVARSTDSFAATLDTTIQDAHNDVQAGQDLLHNMEGTMGSFDEEAKEMELDEKQGTKRSKEVSDEQSKVEGLMTMASFDDYRHIEALLPAAMRNALSKVPEEDRAKKLFEYLNNLLSQLPPEQQAVVLQQKNNLDRYHALRHHLAKNST